MLQSRQETRERLRRLESRLERIDGFFQYVIGSSLFACLAKLTMWKQDPDGSCTTRRHAFPTGSTISAQDLAEPNGNLSVYPRYLTGPVFRPIPMVRLIDSP